MKIRIKGNAIRLRLTRSEVDQFANEGYLEERTEFGNNLFLYALRRSSDVKELTASFVGIKITMLVPDHIADKWTLGDEIGFSNTVEFGNGKQLSLLLEKDFKCIDPAVTEDQSDNYENPLLSCAPAKSNVDDTYSRPQETHAPPATAWEPPVNEVTTEAEQPLVTNMIGDAEHPQVAMAEESGPMQELTDETPAEDIAADTEYSIPAVAEGPEPADNATIETMVAEAEHPIVVLRDEYELTPADEAPAETMVAEAEDPTARPGDDSDVYVQNAAFEEAAVRTSEPADASQASKSDEYYEEPGDTAEPRVEENEQTQPYSGPPLPPNWRVKQK
ncbi:MAG: hypothetical protein V4649_02155 [Bacteroidota bacterium]